MNLRTLQEIEKFIKSTNSCSTSTALKIIKHVYGLEEKLEKGQARGARLMKAEILKALNNLVSPTYNKKTPMSKEYEEAIRKMLDAIPIPDTQTALEEQLAAFLSIVEQECPDKLEAVKQRLEGAP